MNLRKAMLAGVFAGAGTYVPTAEAIPIETENEALSDPEARSLFVDPVPNALDPSFIMNPETGTSCTMSGAEVIAKTGTQYIGNFTNPTNIYGYADGSDVPPTASWPGKTIQVCAGTPSPFEVTWTNGLDVTEHLFPVDTTLHWAYSTMHNAGVQGCPASGCTISADGVPIITHVHGGHNDPEYDGNPEWWYNHDNTALGPQWASHPGGFDNTFQYDINVPAGTLWYHDHALGITRLNVYAGLAGFFFVRDERDTGMAGNPLGLPWGDYELAYAIQDRMFTDTGQLFYPAVMGDPSYAEFVDGTTFPQTDPSVLTEFFGDHMVVNGVLWPKAEVEPRLYRMHFLNGCDSRFLVVRFVVVANTETDPVNAIGSPLTFTVIGSDQGLGNDQDMETLVIEPGSRYDILVDFASVTPGQRVIMQNIGCDAPFGGDYGACVGDDVFGNRRTDRIMAFEVGTTVTTPAEALNLEPYIAPTNNVPSAVTRQVGLFEEMDSFGRLKPMLGAAIPNDPSKFQAYEWSEETTELPVIVGADGVVETWEILNFSVDAHPVHLHLVNFEVLGKFTFTFTKNVVMGLSQYQVTGMTASIDLGNDYYTDSPKDMVTVPPGADPDNGQGAGVRIKAKFDKGGRYVWHCHILSHEDHEMMRVMEITQECTDELVSIRLWNADTDTVVMKEIKDGTQICWQDFNVGYEAYFGQCVEDYVADNQSTTNLPLSGTTIRVCNDNGCSSRGENHPGYFSDGDVFPKNRRGLFTALAPDVQGKPMGLGTHTIKVDARIPGSSTVTTEVEFEVVNCSV